MLFIQKKQIQKHDKDYGIHAIAINRLLSMRVSFAKQTRLTFPAPSFVANLSNSTWAGATRSRANPLTKREKSV
jgi:hypothetical protein